MRFYRDPLGSMVIWAAITLLALLFALLAAAPVFIFVRLIAVALVVGLILVTRRTLPLGVEVTCEGIRIAGTSTRQSIPWGDIRQFHGSRWAFYESVEVELLSGKRVRRPLVQGRKMRWDSGESRDILSVLDAARSASGPAGMSRRCSCRRWHWSHARWGRFELRRREDRPDPPAVHRP